MPGTVCLSSSNHLPTRSGEAADSPVMLPPGRARLATSPSATGSPTIGNTIGMVAVARRAASAPSEPPPRPDDINLQRREFGGQRGQPLGLSLGVAVFDDKIAALDIAEIAQSAEEGLSDLRVAARAIERQIADPRKLAGLLCRGGKPSGQAGGAERRNESASLHEVPVRPTREHRNTQRNHPSR